MLTTVATDATIAIGTVADLEIDMTIESDLLTDDANAAAMTTEAIEKGTIPVTGQTRAVTTVPILITAADETTGQDHL